MLERDANERSALFLTFLGPKPLSPLIPHLNHGEISIRLLLHVV